MVHSFALIVLIYNNPDFASQGPLDETTGKADIWVTRHPAQEATLEVSYHSQNNLGKLVYMSTEMGLSTFLKNL